MRRDIISTMNKVNSTKDEIYDLLLTSKVSASTIVEVDRIMRELELHLRDFDNRPVRRKKFFCRWNGE